jgi:hypothetical protein
MLRLDMCDRHVNFLDIQTPTILIERQANPQWGSMRCGAEQNW